MIKYILSSSLDYQKLICRDAGPGYAEAMGWDIYTDKTHTLFSSDHLYVIDNRISLAECEQFTKIISNNSDIQFIVKIVDPYFEHKNHYYYQWLKQIVQNKNVRLLTVYEPKEFTAYLCKYLAQPIIHVPYAYLKTQELALNHFSKRKNKILISGAVNSTIYPVRNSIWSASRRSISRFFYDTLKHPGYAEIGNKSRQHNVIGDEYVKYLAKYKFMLLCGSRCKIELLKFQECAYAGCLPFGEAPTSLQEISGIFKLPKVSELTFDTTKIIFNWLQSDYEHDINTIRNYLSTNRDPQKLSKALLNHF
ncbi:hypothetical protein [Pedobacter rhizosphaerae]|uniref:Glycosyl transferases group 1 n=1 Tax=Pedobacter rhizosphaerae TaxID=390241 RepID=A0A1H9N7J2_9SPHI|nr:hypothetical protein [Pedobacter rhizosphaerae]SER31625.1 hypothetical protein SAMN04488023_10775 [Pedobacter rhizosphaerae]